MTQETRYFIGFSDVCGIEFECKKCKARVSLKVSDDPPLRCSNCNSILIHRETEDEHAVKDAMFRLSNMSKRQFDSVSIRLEVKGLTDKA